MAALQFCKRLQWGNTMDNKQLYIELAKYKYLKDVTGYNPEYQEKYNAAIGVVLDAILSDLIEEIDEA